MNPVASLICTILLEIASMERLTIKERMTSGRNQYIAKCREQGIKMGRPSTVTKVNCMVMWYLYFGSVRGDLQEGCFSLPNAGFGLPDAVFPPLPEHKIAIFGFFVKFSAVKLSKFGRF